MQDYKKLMIWSKGMEIVDLVFEITKKLPAEELYSLSSQLRRAAISVPSNIAEGSSRSSQKEFNRYLEIALGSLFEMETQLLIAKKHYLNTENLINKCLVTVDEEKKMVFTLKNKLKK